MNNTVNSNFQIRQKLETSPRGIDMFCPREVKELMNQLLKGGEIQVTTYKYQSYYSML